MGYVLFTISAYVFMRAFETMFAGQKDTVWCKTTIKIIACAVLYASVASMIGFYFGGLHLLGFDPK